MDVDDASPALQTRLGSEATAGLLALFDTARGECEANVTNAVVERFEARLAVEMRSLGQELRGEMRDGEARLGEEMRDLAAALRQDSRDQTASLREELRGNVHGLRVEFKQEISNLRVELKEDMSKLRVDVSDALGTTRVDMMRRSFGLWVGQIGATAAIVAGMFRVFAQ